MSKDWIWKVTLCFLSVWILYILKDSLKAGLYCTLVTELLPSLKVMLHFPGESVFFENGWRFFKLCAKNITLVCKNYCISRKIAWSSLVQSLQILGSIGSILLWEYKKGKNSSPQSLHPEQNWCKMYLMCEKFQHHTNILNICVYLQIWSRLRIHIYIYKYDKWDVYIHTSFQ